jgi:two-component system sensor histidine kinase MtrB
MTLRTRVTALFALGALVISVTLAGATYAITRHFIVRQHEVAAQREAFVNASLVETALHSPAIDLTKLLSGLDVSPDNQALIEVRGQLYASGVTAAKDPIRPAMARLVASGKAGYQTYSLGHTPSYVVGVPLPSVHADFFEVASLGSVENTLNLLALILALAALGTTLLGAALGRWASKRALRPLGAVASAAAAIAGGALETRVDSTQAKDLEVLVESFNQMADKLQERIEREIRFTSDVSHELRSPLTTLAASLEVIESHAQSLPERAGQALDLLSSEVRRFTRMVEDLLEISRLDSGTAQLHLEEVKVDELLRHIVDSVFSHPGMQVPVVSIHPGASGALVLADKRRIERVIANLAANAATYAGGVTRISLVPAKDCVRILVDDNGPGIPPEEREKVFERFYRGGAAGARGASEGTGLGLALVAEHIRLHGGSIWVEDSPDGGSRFVIEIPLTKAINTDFENLADQPSIKGLTSPTSTPPKELARPSPPR